MKVIQVIPSYKPAYVYGGPIMSVAKLCEALVETGLDIAVFTTTANGKQELKVKPNTKVIVDTVPVTYFTRITKDHTHFSPALLWALRKEINEKRKTKNELIIHIHSWWNLVSIFTCWIAKFYEIPVVLTPRGMLTQYTTSNRNGYMKSVIHNLLGKRLLKYCHIHATTEKEKIDILEIVKPKSITVIHNLVHTEKLLTDLISLANGEFKLLFLSRIEEKKGLEILFKSIAKLDINWQLTIAGTGEEEYIKQLKFKAQNLKLDKKINWVGHINNIDKFKLISQHDLLVLTSYNENFANVVIESLSVGTPVLLSNQVGLANYVEINELGWITTLNIETITNKIKEAYIDKEKQLKIRAIAPAIISRDFNTKSLTSQYLSLYHSIL